MHLALASTPDNPDFRPESFSELYQRSIYQGMRGMARKTLRMLMGQLYHVERRIWFIEPDALLVILIISGCLWLIYAIPM